MNNSVPTPTILHELARPRTGFDAFVRDIEAISFGVGRSEQSHAWEMYREGVSVETAAEKLAFHRGSVDV